MLTFVKLYYVMLSTQEKPTLSIYLLIVGIYLLITSHGLLCEGMFVDGLIYATIANNLSQGIGTFWNPCFTATSDPVFHSHPPLAFGLQSLFFSAFGHSILVEKFYSLFTFVLVGFILVQLWFILKLSNGWIPLLIWLPTPTVYWALTSNMLENTLSVFTTLSVMFYLKGVASRKLLFASAAGLMLVLGFLTKGLVALFPWTLPFLVWLVFRRISWQEVLFDSVCLVACTVIPIMLLVALVPDARYALQHYLDTQVLSSIQHANTVGSRLYILERLFFELTPAMAFVIVLFVWSRFLKFPLKSFIANYKAALVFVMLGLAGVLPITISMKQNTFYLIPAMPFFALGAGIIVEPFIGFLWQHVNMLPHTQQIFKRFVCGIFIAGVILPFCFAPTCGRDKIKIDDTHKILTVLPKGTIVDVSPSLQYDWSLRAYFARFKNVSLEVAGGNAREYLIVSEPDYSVAIYQNYKPIELNTTSYMLLKKI